MGMAKFGKRSLDRLATCDERLQRVMNIVIRHMDITVLAGHRGREAQNEAFADNKSSLKWPNSRHNKTPSLAIDVAPYPIDWDDIAKFKEMGRLIIAVADSVNVTLEWGGNWTSLKDYPHFQVNKRKSQ